VRGWNLVDNVLDRFSLCDDVTLAVRLENRADEDRFRKAVVKSFPSTWKNGRVVFEVQPPYIMDM